MNLAQRGAVKSGSGSSSKYCSNTRATTFGVNFAKSRLGDDEADAVAERAERNGNSNNWRSLRTEA
jgi:hypothetical protein